MLTNLGVDSKFHYKAGLEGCTPAAADKVAKQFEGLFINQMVSAMRKTVAKGGLVPESNAERVYQSMLDNQYSEKMADTEQLGLSQMIYDHLLRQSRAR
jgi:flagellar protein FlgJ